MPDSFADIEQFGRRHADCGGITPSASALSGGAFQLTLTCVCGNTLERTVTAEEATRPLPLPSHAITPTARRAERPSAPPSAEVEATVPRWSPPSYEAPPAPREDRVPSPAPLWSPPTPTPALAATIRSLPAEPIPPPAAKPAPRPRGRLVWLVLFAIVALGAAAGVYLVADLEKVPVATVASTTAPPPPPSVDQSQRAALEEALRALRQLQAASTPSMTQSVYSSRVVFAKTDVERALAAAGPGSGRTGLREALDIHLMTAAAWKARTLDQKDALDAVGQDAAIELCPSARRVVDFAVQPANLSRGVARGYAVASAIPLFWECAGEKLAAVERDLAREPAAPAPSR